MSLAGIRETDNDTLVSDSSDAYDSDLPGSIEVASYFRWKGILDRLVAAALLVPGIPIICVCVILVRLTSKGSGIYRQTRVGKGEREFKMYKIRTMRQDAEAGTGPVWTKKKDDRITPIGRILRKTHLDEFPQLFNVIKGEMSLIGPRPERPEFVVVLAEQVPNYMDRIEVKPGITGLAQINLDPDVDLESVRRKIVLDREYIQTATLMMDVRMILATLLYIVGFDPARTKKALRVKREVPMFRVTSPADDDDGAVSRVTHSIPPAPSLQLIKVGSKNGSSFGGNGDSPSKTSSEDLTDEQKVRPKPR